MNKTNCEGCENNFYNGNNGLGVKECWNFKTAELVKRIPVGKWQRPPYALLFVEVPNCYHSKEIVYVKEEALTKEGYWKV